MQHDTRGWNAALQGGSRLRHLDDVQVIHGRHDIVAPPKYGERLAGRMACPCIILEGAHFLTRERGPAINALLRHIIMPDAAKAGLLVNRGTWHACSICTW